MAWKENGEYTILLYLGLFVILSSFCHGAKLTRIKPSNPSVALKLKFRDNFTLINGQGNEGSSSDVHHGRLIIGLNSRQGAILKERKSANNFLNVNADYQSDMGWEKPGVVHGIARPDSAAVKQLLQMDPKVECTGHSMKLKVHDAESIPGSLLFVDRGSHLSPLPLSKLPPSCGYTMRSTWKDSVLVAPYDGCFVTQEEDNYVLPLRWCGIQVRMLCPVMKPSSPNPPMVTCHAEGMVVKMEWAIPVKDIKVNLSGQWEPLMKVSLRCGFSVVAHPEGVVVSVRYAPCVEIKDGMFTLELTGKGEIQVSCPSQLVPNPDEPLHPKPTQSRTKSPNQQMDKVVYPFHPWSPHFVTPTLAPHKTSRSPYTTYPQAPVDHPQYPNVPNWPPPTDQRLNRPPQQSKEPGKPESPLGPKPTLAVQPLAPHVPDGQQPQQTTVSPNGQMHQQFYPYPFYPWPPQPKKPTPSHVTQAPHVPESQHPQQSTISPVEKSKAPNGQVHQQFYPYPFYPWPPQPKKPTPSHVTQAPHVPESQHPQQSTISPVEKSKAPNGQVHQQFYPYPFYPWPPQPKKPTPSHVTQAPHVPDSQHPQQSTISPVEKSKAPNGQETFYPHPFYPWPPQPENPPQKTLGKWPQTTQPPNGQVKQPFYPFYTQPAMPETSSSKPTLSPITQAPKGQVKQPFSPLYDWPFKPDTPTLPAQKPVPQPTPASVTQAPKGEVHQPFYPYPFYPYPFYTPPAELKIPFTKETISVTQLPATEAPKGEAHYPYPFYPKWPYNPEPVPNQPAKKPASVTQPPATEVPKGQVHHSFYPYPFYPQQPQIPKPVTNPLTPSAIKPGPATEAPTHPVHPYYLPYKPQNPEPATTPPGPVSQKPDGATVPPSNKWSQKPVNPQPSKPNVPATPEPVVFPQAPQPGTPYNPSVHCPQFCPSGFSNCCPSISFHQHHHHIVPAGIKGDGILPIYPGFPFLPAPGYSIFGYGKESAPPEATTSAPHQSEATPSLPQPTEASTITSEVKTAPHNSQKGFGEYWSHIASPSLPFGSQPEMQPYIQPGSHPIAPHASDPNNPMHPFMYYNSQYPKWPYEQLVGEEHSSSSRAQPPAEGPLMGQPQAFPNKPSKLQAPVSDPMLPYYHAYDFQPLMPHDQPSFGDGKNPSEPEPSLQPYFMLYVPQHLHHPNDPKHNHQLPAMEPQPPAKGLSEPEHPVHQDESELFDLPLVPYHMLHDSQPQVPLYSKPPGSKPGQPSKPQPPVGDSKKSSKTEIDSPIGQYFQPNGYVLLQHGPPGSEPNRSPKSQLPATDPNYSSGPQPSMPVYDPNMFLAPKPQWHRNGKLLNLEGPQGKPQPLKHLDKGMYGNLPNDGASITTEGIGLPLYYPAPSSPHHLSLPQKPFSIPHKYLKPEFPESLKDYWEPIMLSGSSYRIPPPYPGLPSKGQDTSIDHQPNG